MFKERKPIKKTLSKYDKRLPKTILGNAFVGSRTAARFKTLIKFRRKCEKKTTTQLFCSKMILKSRDMILESYDIYQNIQDN